MTDKKTIDPKGLIPDAKWRELMGGISQSTEKRNGKADPDYPPTITRGNRNFKRAGDAYAYLDKLAERARGRPKIAHGISDRNQEVARAARAGDCADWKQLTPGAVHRTIRMHVIAFISDNRQRARTTTLAWL